jgi:hypothetical protein
MQGKQFGSISIQEPDQLNLSPAVRELGASVGADDLLRAAADNCRLDREGLPLAQPGTNVFTLRDPPLPSLGFEVSLGILIDRLAATLVELLAHFIGRRNGYFQLVSAGGVIDVDCAPVVCASCQRNHRNHDEPECRSGH